MVNGAGLALQLKGISIPYGVSPGAIALLLSMITFFGISFWTLFFFIPAITMRSIAEENKQLQGERKEGATPSYAF